MTTRLALAAALLLAALAAPAPQLRAEVVSDTPLPVDADERAPDPLPISEATPLEISRTYRELLGEVGLVPDDIGVRTIIGEKGADRLRQIAVRRHYFQGRYFLQVEQPTAALGEFEAAAELEPANAHVTLAIANAQLRAKNPDGAARTIQAILKDDPKNVQALILKGRMNISRSEAVTGTARTELLKQAAGAFNLAVESEPRNLEALRGLVHCYGGLEDIPKIINSLRQMVEINPRDTYSMLVLAMVLSRNNRYQEAVTWYERVIEQRRGFITAYVSLGQTYEELRRDQDALNTYKQALLIDPRNDQVLTRFDAIVRRLARQRSGDGALREYEKFASEYPYSSEIQSLLAQQYVLAKDLDKAIRQYSRVLELDSENLDALAAIGSLHMERQNFDEAIRHFSRAIDINPEKVEIYDAISAGLLQQNNRTQAIELYEKAIKLNPSVDRLYVNLAMLLDQEKRADRAIEVLEEALDRAGRKPEILATLGSLLEREGRIDAAVPLLREAYEAAPQNAALLAKLLATLIREQKAADIDELVEEGLKLFDQRQADFLSMVAESFYAEGQLTLAAQYFKRALAENPQQIACYLRLVQIYSASQEYDEAERVLDGAPLDLQSSDELALLRSDVLQAREDYEAAITILRGRLDKQTEPRARIDLISKLVDVLNAAGRHDDAFRTIADAEKQSGRSEELDFLRGVTYYQQKKYDQAERAFKDLAQRNRKKADLYNFFIGSIYLDQKRYEAAERALRRAIELNPNNENALNALGYMLADRGMKLDEAEDLVRRAIELNPSAPHIIDSMGWVRFRQGHVEEARRYIERAAAMMGDNAEILDHLGDIYVALGDVPKALEFWRRSFALDKTRVAVRDKIAEYEKQN